MVRPRVFLDIVVGTQPAGRITIELFNDHTPQTCENFRLLCTGSRGKIRVSGTTHDLCYRNSTFHRIISEFMIQGGDIINNNGTGGSSAYPGGRMFADENLGWRNIDAEGLVCMANRGRGTNSSQFFITLADCEYLTQKHTVFGHVVAGMDVVKRLEQLPVTLEDRPLEPVIIANCGELLFRKKEPVPAPASSPAESRRERSHSRDRKKDDHRHRRARHNRSKSPSKDASKDVEKTRDTVKGARYAENGPNDTGIRGRSKEQDDTPVVASPRHTSRSRSRHKHGRRRHHSESQSPERRRHKREHREMHGYTRDEGAEDRIRREEEEREMGRFAAMGQERKGEPEVKFKGRGSMKYREKKIWGWGGGEGRLV